MRFLWTSLGWLGGAVKRAIALLSAVLTLMSIAGFVVTGALTWAALAICVLLLLVGGLGWSLHDEYRKRLALESADDKPALLARAITDGRALLAIDVPLKQHREWEQWSESTEDMLRSRFGIEAAVGFDSEGRKPGVRGRIAAQVAYLEGLQAKQPVVPVASRSAHTSTERGS